MTYFYYEEISRELERAKQQESPEPRWKEDRSDYSRQTYEPYRRGYVFDNTPKPEPFEPIEPLFRRKPRPGEFRLEGNLKVLNEPLTDLIDYGTEVNAHKISAKDVRYVQLNATKGADDIEVKDFYRMFRLPRDIEVGKASFRENNRVLDETIPRQANSPELWAEGEVE